MKMHTGLFADTNMILSPSFVHHEHGVASYTDPVQIHCSYRLNRQMNDNQDKAARG